MTTNQAAFVEIEQKYRIRNVQTVRRTLKKIGAVKTASGKEHNELYDTRGRLKRKRYVLRLRQYGRKQSWLTVKGPRIKGRHKKRIEIETPVLFKETRLILELLGLKKVLHYDKYRESYRLGGAKICLDRLRKFGWFLEIEAKPRTIDQIARQLNLTPEDEEARTYLEILF